MAITTYQELQNAIADFVSDGASHLTSQIPLFITLAEAQINRELRIAAMEARATYNTTPGDGYVQVPAGFLEVRDLVAKGDIDRKLQFLPSPAISGARGSGPSGKPRQYALTGSEVRLAPVPDGEYQLEMIYYKRFPALTDAEPTNWLLANAPDALLYGALIELGTYDDNERQVQVWQTLYRRAINGLQYQDSRQRWSGSPIVEMAGGATP